MISTERANEKCQASEGKKGANSSKATSRNLANSAKLRRNTEIQKHVEYTSLMTGIRLLALRLAVVPPVTRCVARRLIPVHSVANTLYTNMIIAIVPSTASGVQLTQAAAALRVRTMTLRQSLMKTMTLHSRTMGA